ncbi:hypothetical protein [Hanstruepera marina]|uniref:hypothetical protein n=1 Tax=Hanstruepera marina TaxID=2873265 RepID=UPI001CA6AFB1|nr:hypothetical protein [Hanstruepera marina]
MSRFLKHIGLLIIPIFLVWFTVELFYRNVSNNYTFKNQLIKNESKAVEVLIFGDSHTFYGLNPEYFSSSTVNMANVSQTIYFDKLLFEAHISKLTNLKCIVIPIEYTTFSQADNTQEDYWRKYFYASQMDLTVPYIKWYDPKQYSLALTQKLGKTATYVKMYLKTKTLVGCDKKGWGNTYISTVDSLELERLSKLISRKHDDGSMDFSKNIERINTMIQTCKTYNVKVLLVNMPVSQPYLSLLDQEEVAAISRISKAFDFDNEHVTHVNLLYDNSFSRNDFHDADHLNVNGAKKCSTIINSVIENL